MPEQRDELSIVRDICERRAGERTGVALNILSDVVDELRFVPREAFGLIADAAGVSPAVIELICARSAWYTTERVGEHLVVVCDGSACHNRGAVEILQAIEFELGIKPGQTTPDGRFTLRTASCVGSCSRAPVLGVDGAFVGSVRNKDILKTIEGCVVKGGGRA